MENDPSKPIYIDFDTKEKPKITTPSLFVATPVHSEVSIHYTQTLLDIQKLCAEKKITCMFQLMKSSLVTQGRNLCVSAFLESGFSHMLFIDSDISFDAESVFKMIEKDKEIIAMPYPLKSAKWEKMLNKIKDGVITTPQEAHFGINTYPIRLADETDIDFDDGVIEVTHSPTGCMLIQKRVFDKLIKEYPGMDIKQETVINGKFVAKPHLYNFFDTYHDKETKMYLGEDFAFCRLWRNIGGKCYCYITDYISHTGEFSYSGRLIDEMTKLEVENTTDQG